MMHAITRAMQAEFTGEQITLAVVFRTRLAQRGAPLRTRIAMPATGHENAHHVIAANQIVNASSHLFDDAGRFVPQHHRQRPGSIAIDDGQVGMTETRRRDLDQNLARSGTVEVDVLHLERA